MPIDTVDELLAAVRGLSESMFSCLGDLQHIAETLKTDEDRRERANDAAKHVAGFYKRVLELIAQLPHEDKYAPDGSEYREAIQSAQAAHDAAAAALVAAVREGERLRTAAFDDQLSLLTGTPGLA
ncbi:hypothetical protein DIPPA_18597 [Diplonema papillatum]|nr:hypothetical protein DIPPA_18597 [Diplonema papillatum]